MRIETPNAIYEDTLNKLVPRVSSKNTKVTYECSCGEVAIHDMCIVADPNTLLYYYSFTCGCGNKLKVTIKDY
jgi:hypothetical protein